MRAGKAIQRDLPCLTNLRHLDVSFSYNSERKLPRMDELTWLTYLCLVGFGDGVLDAGGELGLRQLTNLRVLKLLECGDGFDAAMFLSMAKLQELMLADADFVSYDGTVSAQVLLQAVGQMQELAVLRIQNCTMSDAHDVTRDYKKPLDSYDYSRYAAFTASTHLKFLELDAVMPPWGWSHILDPNQPPSLNLTAVSLNPGIDPEETGFPPSAVPQDVLQQLALRCPAVDSLTLSRPESLQLELIPLAQLSGLTKLKLDSIHNGVEPTWYSDSEDDEEGVWFRRCVGLTVDSALGVVTTLTTLQDISLIGHACGCGDIPYVTDKQLLRLTALQQLPRLYVPYKTQSVYMNEWRLELCNEAEDGSPPDVWMQIVKHCRKRKRQQRQQQQRQQSAAALRRQQQKQKEVATVAAVT